MSMIMAESWCAITIKSEYSFVQIVPQSYSSGADPSLRCRLKDAFKNICGKVTHCKGCFDKWLDAKEAIKHYCRFEIDEDRACKDCADDLICQACGLRHEYDD